MRVKSVNFTLPPSNASPPAPRLAPTHPHTPPPLDWMTAADSKRTTARADKRNPELGHRAAGRQWGQI